MKRLTATHPLMPFVAALAVGLAACTDDGAITEPPPPPPPPPPAAAEISITSIVDPETGTALPESNGAIPVSGRIGVVIDFDTGEAEAQSLDLILENAAGATDAIPCDGLSGQAAAGLDPAVQSVQCVIDTGEGAGPCQGTAQSARFANGRYTISAELTLKDGTAVSDEGAAPLDFENSESAGSVLDIGPRVVSVGDDFPEFGAQAGVEYWGGPRDLSWTVCAIVFTPSLADICRIEISAGTLAGTGDLDLGNGPGQRASSEVPFRYTALYRAADGTPVNEDSIEDDPAGGGHVIGDGPTGFRVFLCDGTNVTSSFDIESDVRHLDTTAPACDPGSCEPEIDAMPVLQNGLYGSGEISLSGLADGGVGGVYGVTTVVDAFEFDSGDPDLQALAVANPAVVGDLPEDDGCGGGQTTNSAVQLGCGGTEAGVPVDAYFLVVSEVADLLGNALGDGTADRNIDDEFADSDEFGVDISAPSLDDLRPPDTDPVFVWNPNVNNPAFDCPGPAADCETIMFESIDPDLASGDAPSGVEDASCIPICADDDGDGNRLEAEIISGPAGGNEGEILFTNNIGQPADMFQAEFCDGGGAGAECDGTDDGAYVVEIRVNDQAVKENNVTVMTVSFNLDTSAPQILPFTDFPPGVAQSNAAALQFNLAGSLSDPNLLQATATIEMVISAPGPPPVGVLGTCGTSTSVLVPEGTGAGEVDDNTQDITATADNFSVSFVVQNADAAQTATIPITYCFIVDAEDTAELKDGADNHNLSQEFTQSDVTWNP